MRYNVFPQTNMIAVKVISIHCFDIALQNVLHSIQYLLSVTRDETYNVSKTKPTMIIVVFSIDESNFIHANPLRSK